MKVPPKLSAGVHALSARLREPSMKLLLTGLALFVGLFRLQLLSVTQYKLLSLGLMGLLLGYYGRREGVLYHCRYGLALAGALFLSTLAARPSMLGFLNACVYALCVSAIFVVTSALVWEHGLTFCVRAYESAAVMFATLTDITVLSDLQFDLTRYQNLSYYLTGNKFVVSYLHMLALGLMALSALLVERRLTRRTQALLLLYGIYSVVICKLAACSTGILGIACLVVLLLFPLGDGTKSLLAKPWVMFCGLGAANIMLLTKWILNNSLVQYVIVNLLHEDLTLTGRFVIYDRLWSVIQAKPLLGYGYESTIITDLLGYGNAQNGILQYLVDCGVVGTVVFLLCWIRCIRAGQQRSGTLWPLFALTYAFSFCSLVEVSFKYPFLVTLALLLAAGPKELPRRPRTVRYRLVWR